MSKTKKKPLRRGKSKAQKDKEAKLQVKVGKFFYIYGKTHEEICGELGLCRNTVAKYLEKAREQYLAKIQPGRSDEILAQAAARFELLANDAVVYRMKASDDKRVRASKDAASVLKDQIGFFQDIGLVDRVPAAVDLTVHDEGADALLAAFVKDFDKKIDEGSNGKTKRN